MEIDNTQDRYAYGYDAGQIVEGVILYDDESKTHVIVNSNGIGYSTEQVLSTLVGQKVRLNLVMMEIVHGLGIPGSDAGQILEGTVQYNKDSKSHSIVSDIGMDYSIESILRSLKGQTIRLTLATLEAMQRMQSMLNSKSN